MKSHSHGATMPPFPTFPAREDWFRAARSIHEPIPSPFDRSYVGGQILFLDRLDTRPRELHLDDPLGALVASARDRMRTRHRNSPAYLAFLDACARERQAAVAAEEAARVARAAARSAKERAEEDAFYEAGGTAVEWAIHLEAKAQEKADTARKRRTASTRSKARSTRAPTQRVSAAPSTTKGNP